MPIYEFRCRECNGEQESLQKVNDPIPSVCASCGKENSLEKVVSHTSFQLKGGGWYSDLYASPKAGDAAKSTPVKSESAPTKVDPPSSN